MPDQQINQITIHDLRKKVSWLFYGTRQYVDLDDADKEIVNDIVQDGYSCFLHPLPLPNEAESYRWNFLRPYLPIVTEDGVEDYDLPTNFGGFEGNLYYGSTADKQYSLQKTFAERILQWRQRDTTSFSYYPTHYAIVGDNIDTTGVSVSRIMIWPTPDNAYTLIGRYYVLTPPMDDGNPYPACDQFHNRTLEEAVLCKAEERLEDQQGLHAQLFMERMRASVSHDRDKFSADSLGVDVDHSDYHLHDHDYRAQGNYVSYNGYTPGA